MKIMEKIESREQCTEAGWYAYDYNLERALLRKDIEQFRELEADFIYLTGLKQPFFKIENTYYMLKGVEGKPTIRLSVYKEYEEELCKEIEAFFEKII